MLGQVSDLSLSESADFRANFDNNERFQLFKILIRSRVPSGDDKKQIFNIFDELEDGLESSKGWFGRSNFELFSESEYKIGQVCCS